MEDLERRVQGHAEADGDNEIQKAEHVPDPSAVVLTGFPMALVPTFLVPMSMLLHVLSLRYLLGARTASVGTRVSPATHLESSRS